MGLLTDLPRGAIVGIETAPFIYLIEQHPAYDPIVTPFFFATASRPARITA